MSEICKVCGRTLAQSLGCGYCYALANPAANRSAHDDSEGTSDLREADWQEACNPNEGSK